MVDIGRHWCTLDTVMGKRLSAELKCRVNPEVRRSLEVVASARELKVSDLVRESLRDYLPRQPEIAFSLEETPATAGAEIVD